MGTFASAAGGGKSEQKGVAAVEIFARERRKISGTATGHNGAAPLRRKYNISVILLREFNIYGDVSKWS